MHHELAGRDVAQGHKNYKQYCASCHGVNLEGQLVDQFVDTHSVAHGGYLGNYARAMISKSQVRKGDRIRLRLINCATNRVFEMKIMGAWGQILAFDGIALPQPRPMRKIQIAPAQRMDFILDVQDKVTFELMTRGDDFRLGEIKIRSENKNRAPPPVTALPQSHRHIIIQPPKRHMTLEMMGGAMGTRHNGDNIWALNNVSDLQENPW